MKNLREAFGLKVREIRKVKNYTQEVFAEMIDLSPRQLIRIENGENFPSADTLGKISLTLNVQLKKLFDFQWNENEMYFTNNLYKKPFLRVIKNGDDVIIKQISQSKKDSFETRKNLKINEYESLITNFCKKTNKSVTVEIFENKKRMAIKTFHPNNKIQTILSEEDVQKNELYDEIITRISNLSSDEEKLKYIKIAMDALDDKVALEKLLILIQGIKLVINK